MGDPLRPMRQDIVIPPTGQVRVVFDVRGEEGLRFPLFECEPCREVLRWAPDARLWLCPGCEYELTFDEARIVVADAERLLGVMRKYIVSKETRGLALVAAKRVGFRAWVRNLWARLWVRRRAGAASSRSSATD